MSTDLERSFLMEILRDPEDPLPRKIFADWLEEQGDERAELVRILGECIWWHPGVQGMSVSLIWERNPPRTVTLADAFSTEDGWSWTILSPEPLDLATIHNRFSPTLRDAQRDILLHLCTSPEEGELYDTEWNPDE